MFPEEIVPEQPAAPFMQFPGAGALHAEPLAIEGQQFVAVANHFSGCEPNGYEQDSVLYRVNYTTGTYERHQSFSTTGAGSMRAFSRTAAGPAGEAVTKQYLWVASRRNRFGPTTQSTLYQWTRYATAAGAGQCAASNETCYPPCGRGAVLRALRPQARRDLDGRAQVAAALGLARRVGRPATCCSRRRPGNSKILRFASPFPRPSVSVQGPSVLASCDALVLDGSLSSGQAGRRFAVVNWTLIEGGSAPGYAGTGLRESVAAGDSLVLRLERGATSAADWEVFFPPGAYRVRLDLTNWAGGRGYAEHAFVKLNGTAPGVAVSLQAGTIRPFQPLEAYAAAVRPASCGGAGQDAQFATAPLVYAWALADAATGAAVTVPGALLSAAKLLLPAYALVPGRVYRVSCTVSMLGLSSSAERTVAVLPAAPEAIIGRRRPRARAAER